MLFDQGDLSVCQILFWYDCLYSYIVFRVYPYKKNLLWLVLCSSSSMSLDIVLKKNKNSCSGEHNSFYNTGTQKERLFQLMQLSYHPRKDKLHKGTYLIRSTRCGKKTHKIKQNHLAAWRKSLGQWLDPPTGISNALRKGHRQVT